jgi:nicotinate-nucleotide adenylyltransferase
MSSAIGLFGGTFDPVHNGHVGIAKAFLSSDLLEELWVLLTPDPPHKSESVHASFVYREKMLEAAFANEQDIKISTIENTLPRPTYTIQTLEFLKKNHPADTFYLCIGEDSLVHFNEWYRYRAILDHCELIVARRPGFNGNSVSKRILDRVHFIDHKPVDISSSQIRELIKQQESVSQYISEGVLDIIQGHNLYQNEN